MSWRRASLAAGLAALATSFWWTATGFGLPQTQERIFAVVHDAGGAPVRGLTGGDFVVQIDGEPMEVVSARPATVPPFVVLLTDQLGLTSAYPLADLREAIGTFVVSLRQAEPESRFGLVTFDGAPRVRARFDTAPVLLQREIDQLAGVAPTSVLLDGVQRAAEMLSVVASDRRLIVALYSSYRPDRSVVRSDDLGEHLRRSGASLWSIEAVADVGWQVTEGVGTSPAGNYASAPRELVVSEGGTRSGGTRVTVTNRLELRQAFVQLAHLLTTQYEVVYGPDVGTVRSQRIVGVRRDGVRVLAPSWVAK